MTTSVKAALALSMGTLFFSSGCTPEPTPGELGIPRFAGQVFGETPLPMVPPVHDRDGNAYVLYGDTEDLNPINAWVGHRGGNWTGPCNIQLQGPVFGLHGIVGRSQNRAWYWAGAQKLVEVKGTAGGCTRVLAKDPTSGSRIDFKAVIPYVREAPSLTSIVGAIQALTDPVPFITLVDLKQRRYISLDRFEPSNAENVEVLGVGADARTQEGVIIWRYLLGQEVRVEARFYDYEAREIDSVRLSGFENNRAYSFRGFLQADETGLWGGLDGGFRQGDMLGEPSDPPRILVLDKSGAEIVAPNLGNPIGVHAWEGKLFLVGEDQGEPRTSLFDSGGGLDSPKTWDASLDMVRELGNSLDVIDDRSLPSRDLEWSNPRTAIGPFPFLSPHSLDAFATGTTGWLVAGPSFSVSAGNAQTAVAYVPVGVAYEE